MGNIIMPKNSAAANEMEAVFSVYAANDGWITNQELIDRLKILIGEQEPQAYTKKTQIPAYFGFIDWEDPAKSTSRRRITESGKRFYEGLINHDKDAIYKELLHSLKTRSFGRNVIGVASDSNIEPPQLFIRCTLVLGFLTRKEYAYILWRMDEFNEDIFDLLSVVSKNRINNEMKYSGVPNTYTDAKPITALVNWGFLQELEEKINGQGKIVINNELLTNNLNDLFSLKIFNNEEQRFHLTDIDESAQNEEKNRIFYGAPGTGKSYTVKELTKGKEQRTQRVTFHPEYDYASFIGGYKPTMNGNDIRYEFVPQIFTNAYANAWNDLNNDYYLIIEEINRGNCAEIFGDTFQLLDREDNYAISPSKELKEYLEIALADNDNITADKMLLPPNLFIMATMNTSDQSLFPMDSAFKRRWKWEYVPIDYEFSEKNKSSKYKVILSEDESFSWLSFIEKLNEMIRQNENLGMDKCVGNYFVKVKNDTINIDTFINKVMFYLWNDVFKDEMEEHSIFKGKSSYEDFFPIGSNGIQKVKEILEVLQVEITVKPSEIIAEQ